MRQDEPESAPAIIDAGVLHIRSRALRSELAKIAREIMARHPGRKVTPSGLAQEALWLFLRDDALRAKLSR